MDAGAVIPAAASSLEQPPAIVLTTFASVELLHGAAGHTLFNHWSTTETVELEPVARPTKVEGLRQAEAPGSLLTTKSAAEQFAEILTARLWLNDRADQKMWAHTKSEQQRSQPPR